MGLTVAHAVASASQALRKSGLTGLPQSTSSSSAGDELLDEHIRGYRGRLVKRKEHAEEEEGEGVGGVGRGGGRLGGGLSSTPGALHNPPPRALPPHPAAKLHPERTYFYRPGNVDELLEACNRRVRAAA